MTKKRKQPTLEEVLDRPWCYYCERDFDDQKVLASHQKAKHFRCKNCNRRLNTIGGLSVHLSQVHKETLEHVEEALPNRNNTQLEIFGMEGVPQDIMDQHRQRVIREYTEAHGHRQFNNNQVGENANKKPKLETKEEMKARLAAFKAKKAAGELPTAANGNGTPTQAKAEESSLAVPYDHSQGLSQSPAPFQGGNFAPPLPPNQGHIIEPSPGFQSPPGPQPPSGFQAPPTFQPSSGFQPPPGFQPPYQPYGQPFFPAPQQQQPGPFPHHPPFGQPFAPSFSPPPGSFNDRQAGSPANGGPFSPPNGSPYAPPPGFHPPGQPLPPPGSTLPTAPGLPRRPAFQPPEMSASQFQQLHQGQQYDASKDPRSRSQKHPVSQPSHLEADVDQLIADGAAYAARQEQIKILEEPDVMREQDQVINNPTIRMADSTHNPKIRMEQVEHDEQSKAISQKKSKNETFVLMYDDNEKSPEEKMAALPRYAFDPKKQADETTLETTTEAIGANFTGPVVGEDDVVDNQGD